MRSLRKGSMQNSDAAPALPRIRRARGYRLYDMQGKRILDLYRDGALLGHRGASAVTAMKAGLSEGLAASLPSAWEGRLCAALARMFPGYPSVRIFSSRARALAALSLRSPWDPALADADAAGDPAAPNPRGTGVPVRPEGRTAAPNPRNTAALWRPFLPAPAGARVLLPVLPLTMCGAPAPACLAAGPQAAFARFRSPSRFPSCWRAARAGRSYQLFPQAPRFAPGQPDPRKGGGWRARMGAHRPLRSRRVSCRPVSPRSRRVSPCRGPPVSHLARTEHSSRGVFPGENRLLADLFAGHPGG